jgi:hypothetical protein
MKLISNKLISCKIQANKGFITLMATLLVVAVGLSISVSLLILGVDSSRTSFVIVQSYQASSLANACAEESLQLIYDSMAVVPPPDPVPFTGTGSLTMGQGGCSYTVTDTGGGTMDITTSGTVGTAIRKNQILLSSVSPITVSSWQEIQ